jgi:TonB family protein
MRIVALALIGGLAFSQTGEDAKKLLQDVADAAASATNWQIEGSIDYPGSLDGTAPSEQFKLLIRAPDSTRFEQTGRSAPAVIICDGSSAWEYSTPLRRYRQEPSSGNKLCSLIVGDWRLLPSTLQSPTLTGSCGADPSAQSPDYQLVRGFSDPEISSAGRITRTLCIDPTRKIVVWEKWESRYSTRIYTYSWINTATDLPPKTFVFEPPTGSTSTDLELPMPRPLGTRGLSMGPGVSLPKVLSKVEPQYGEKSRKARIEGTVVLHVVIGNDGVPAEVLVYRELSKDLDEAAIRAIRRWRFSPGLRNGQPAVLPVIVEMNFRLGPR